MCLPLRIKCKHLIVDCKTMNRHLLAFPSTTFPTWPCSSWPVFFLFLSLPQSLCTWWLFTAEGNKADFLLFSLRSMFPIWGDCDHLAEGADSHHYWITSLQRLWNPYQHLKLSLCVICLFISSEIWSLLFSTIPPGCGSVLTGHELCE